MLCFEVPGALAGLRVVRGPDWQHGDEDGGDGHVGTVQRYRDQEGCVTVFWDNGNTGTYRTDRKQELLVLDPGPAGKYDISCCVSQTTVMF